jgi:hypothetical protein
MEWLSASVLIGYKDYGIGSNYPTGAQKAAVLAGANLAKKIISKANDEFAAVVMLRRKESPLFQQVCAAHFGLIAGDTSGGYLTDNVVDKPFSLRALGQRDRRWVLEKIRENILSVSFHLNTGMYLIDTDETRRDIESGRPKVPAPGPSGNEAYVSPEKTNYNSATWRYDGGKWVDGCTCGFRHGEIHISFENIQNYTPISYARVVVHEATHKWLNTDDKAYAHDPNYATLSLVDALNNAESYAWAAVSLYCGALKMGTTADYPGHWMQCQKP